MAYKYITIPEDVKLKNLITGEELHGDPVAFGRFVTEILLLDPRWGSDFKWMKSGLAIASDVRAVEPGQVLKLAEEDYNNLKAVAEGPTFKSGMGTERGFAGFTSLGAMQLVPFVEAIVDAKSKPPLAAVTE